ncbi:MAG: NAD-dependent epimerase/dehydratase family protein [Alphaproteobacteria bacterium]
MKVLVTGATGFIGRHLITELLKNNHHVIATALDDSNLKTMPWNKEVEFKACDLTNTDLTFADYFGIPDALIHLAWAGLPNYKDLFHFEKNLPQSYDFIKQMVKSGCKQVMITGTCFEYGMQEGCLNEDMPTKPSNPYGLAKDVLRRFLMELQKKEPFTLKWVRLFYLYGYGQSPKSILSQLDKAISDGDKTFNMSGGEQLRDYLPIETVAYNMVKILEHKSFDGIVNCCSGSPISIKDLVASHIAEKNSDIKPNLGFYPYPDYEPMTFWGDNTKLQGLLK